MSTASDARNNDRSASNKAVLAAVWLTLAGGIVGAVAEFANLPTWLLLAGLTALIGGTVPAVVFAFISSRRDGTSVARSLARAVEVGFGWRWNSCLGPRGGLWSPAHLLDSPTG